jgi:Fe2+ transport system protein FeoA
MMTLRPLASLQRMESGRVVSIGPVDSMALHDLMAAGLLCGARVDVVRCDAGKLLIIAGCHEVALDQETATRILLQVMQ